MEIIEVEDLEAALMHLSDGDPSPGGALEAANLEDWDTSALRKLCDEVDDGCCGAGLGLYRFNGEVHLVYANWGH